MLDKLVSGTVSQVLPPVVIISNGLPRCPGLVVPAHRPMVPAVVPSHQWPEVTSGCCLVSTGQCLDRTLS